MDNMVTLGIGEEAEAGAIDASIASIRAVIPSLKSSNFFMEASNWLEVAADSDGAAGAGGGMVARPAAG